MAGRGAPLGNDNATKAKPWRAALDRALAQDDGKKLRAAAEKLLSEAAKGEGWAIKELGDRLDGKSIQEIAAQVDASVTVEIMRFADKTPK
jgi:hypothetical protein